MWKVQLFELNFDQREAQAVAQVIESGWITMGERIKEFEARFGKLLGNGVGAVAVSNGTAALHMALLALDIKVGDEVIVPALTFVADINVVRMVGAKPVLADCTSLYDWNMNPADIEAKNQLTDQGGDDRALCRTTLTLDRHEGRAITYDVVQPGLNLPDGRDAGGPGACAAFKAYGGERQA